MTTETKKKKQLTMKEQITLAGEILGADVSGLKDVHVVDAEPQIADPVLRARRNLLRLLDWAKTKFLERDDAIDCIGTALIAGEHVFLIGPPGTAKSELIESICNALGGTFFNTLCHRYQTPDEVFGPISLKAMQDDRLMRKTANRLPEADIAFFDEMFKGSAALLNTLLRAINERTFEQDGKHVPLQIRMIAAASNELPDEGDHLGAFYDRFMFRLLCEYMKDESNARAVFFDKHDAGDAPSVAPGDVDLLSDAMADVEITKDAEDAVLKIRDALKEKGVRVSDRRWRKTTKLLRADAVLNGRPRVTSAVLNVLEHCLWDRPEQIHVVREVVRAHVATWVKVTKDANAALDEQLARIQQAAQKGGKRHEGIAQLAKSLDALIDIDATMDTLVTNHPESKDDADKVRARIAKAKVELNAGMRALGIDVSAEKAGGAS